MGPEVALKLVYGCKLAEHETQSRRGTLVGGIELIKCSLGGRRRRPTLRELADDVLEWSRALPT